MPIIEFKQIENFFNEQPSNYDWLWGVAIGFALSFSQSEYQRYKDNIKVVRLFENELERIEPDFEKQITALRKYIKAIKEYEKEVSLEFSLPMKLVFIKQLDIQILSRYFGHKRFLFLSPRKDKNYVSDIMTNINVTDIQLSELKSANLVYTEKLLDLINQYMFVVREMTLKVTNSVDTMRMIAGRVAGYTAQIFEIFGRHLMGTEYNVGLMMKLYKTFHVEIAQKVGTDELYFTISALNIQALGIIGKVITLDLQHLGMAEPLEKLLKEQYERIYKKQLNIAP